MSKKIDSYKYPYNTMALISQERQGNKPNPNLTLDHKRDEGGFNWKDTEEGYDFWRAVSNDLEPKITYEIMSNYPDGIFLQDYYDSIWCFEDGNWFETILLVKLSDRIDKPYCVIDKDDFENYKKGNVGIKTKMFSSYDISLCEPDNITDSTEITLEEGIKLLEEYGYKIKK